jgi:hypothetical protein
MFLLLELCFGIRQDLKDEGGNDVYNIIAFFSEPTWLYSSMMSAEMTRYTSTPHQRCLQMFQTLSARER